MGWQTYSGQWVSITSKKIYIRSWRNSKKKNVFSLNCSNIYFYFIFKTKAEVWQLFWIPSKSLRKLFSFSLLLFLKKKKSFIKLTKYFFHLLRLLIRKISISLEKRRKRLFTSPWMKAIILKNIFRVRFLTESKFYPSGFDLVENNKKKKCSR